MKNKLSVGFWILMILWLREGEIRFEQKRLFYTTLTLQTDVETSPELPTKKGYSDRSRYPRHKNSPKPNFLNVKKRRF